MADISRRDFVKGLAVGGTVGYFAMAGISSSVLRNSLIPQPPAGTAEIGECKSVTVKVISETSWFKNAVTVADMQNAGGLLVNQYTIPWTHEGVEEGYNGDNRGGYSTLITVEQLDGTKKNYLLDCGWNTAWMDVCFEREGIDRMLENGEIDALIVSHEHFDHYWGVESVLKHRPDIPVIVPDGFYDEGFQLLKGAEFPECFLSNSVPHTGPLEVRDSSKLHQMLPGMVTMTFDVPIICRVFGEQGIVFNVKDKGLFVVTGCCHMGIISLMERVRSEVKGGDNLYAVQGGLHISPFEDWDPQYDDLVLAIGNYGLTHLGCNHCTGYVTAEKMVNAGLPVVRGTAQHKSRRDIYLGNGDTMTV